MKRSIHRFLIINILIAVSSSILIGVTTAIYLKHRHIKLHLDTELALQAHELEAFLHLNPEPEALPLIQRKINEIPNRTIRTTSQNDRQSQIIHRLKNNTQYQIWDQKTKRLILRSPSAPPILINPDYGYHTITHLSQNWRTFSIETSNQQYLITTMQQHELRIRYEQDLAYETLCALSIISLILVLSTRTILKRGLYALDMTAAKLQTQNTKHLKPICTKDTPDEIVPLINEINRLMSELSQTLKRERRFAGDAAHELKTPLAAMKAHIQLAHRQDPIEQRKTLKRIEDIITRYDHIIKQLLSLSRTISESGLKEHTKCNLVTLAQNVIAQAVPSAHEKQIQVALECKNSEIVKNINSHVFSVMLSNIIDNAIKYTYPGDTIIIKLDTNYEGIIIKVIDHGPGISDSDKLTVTQRFKRVYGTEVSGSGLGLNIVLEVVKHLDGTLMLIDTPAGGLTVQLTLPANN